MFKRFCVFFSVTFSWVRMLACFRRIEDFLVTLKSQEPKNHTVKPPSDCKLLPIDLDKLEKQGVYQRQ